MNKNARSIIIISFITVFFDMMNSAIIVPILPYLVQELNSSSMEEGILFSSYAIFQLISLLIAGPLSDVYGRKPFLLLSLFGSFVGSIFQGMSKSMLSLIIWRSFTGLFSGSLILGQAVIADVIPPDKRSAYISRLDGCNSVAYIIGPAIGGVLSQVSYQFPFYAAGVVSGIAMFAAFIWLKESNPLLVDENGNKREKSLSKTFVTVDKKSKEDKRVKPRLNSLMIRCFISEFCVRWTTNAYDSRYGIYLRDKFDVKSGVYSTMVAIQSLLCAFFHLFIYPWAVDTMNIPIPYLCMAFYPIMFISYIGMVVSKTVWGSMIWCTILWFAFAFVSPSSVSIISTTNAKEVQGEVLSWNNFCIQASLITCPIVLSAIYPYSMDGIYYFSAIFDVIGFISMSTLSCRKDVKTLGKVSMTTNELPISNSHAGGEMVEEKPATLNNEVEMVEKKGEVQIQDGFQQSVGQPITTKVEEKV